MSKNHASTYNLIPLYEYFMSKNHASTYDLIPLYEYLFDSVWICKANSRVGESISTVGPPRSARGLSDKKGMLHYNSVTVL